MKVVIEDIKKDFLILFDKFRANKQELVANAQEAKARGGRLIVFAFEGQDELCELAEDYFLFPKVKPLLGPLAMTGLMQFFAYQVALELGCPIDKPRNISKTCDY